MCLDESKKAKADAGICQTMDARRHKKKNTDRENTKRMHDGAGDVLSVHLSSSVTEECSKKK